MAKVTNLNVGEGNAARGRSPHLRDLAPDADIPLGTIGQELRGARISRGEDLSAVSRVLKIRKDYLEALENDDTSRLPGRTYAVGFVRAYADYLSLNPREAVERFKTEIAGRDETSRTAGFPEPEAESSFSGGWLLLTVIVLGLIAYGIYYLFSGDGQPNQAVTAVPSQMIEKPAYPAVQATRRERVASPSSVGAAGRSAGPASGKGQIYGKMNLNPHVMLRVIRPTRILVQTEDGRPFINHQMLPGDVYQVPNMRGLALTAEHGNAVEIVVDGKPRGNAGSSADPAEAISLDSDSQALKHAPSAPSQ